MRLLSGASNDSSQCQLSAGFSFSVASGFTSPTPVTACCTDPRVTGAVSGGASCGSPATAPLISSPYASQTARPPAKASSSTTTRDFPTMLFMMNALFRSRDGYASSAEAEGASEKVMSSTAPSGMGSPDDVAGCPISAGRRS